MNQNKLKIALSVAATIVAAAIGAQAAGQLHLPALAVELLGLSGTLLGMFGASPIGRVLGRKETRDVGPTFPAAEPTDGDWYPRIAKPSTPREVGAPPRSEDEITADERPPRR